MHTIEELKFIQKWLEPLLRFVSTHEVELACKKGSFRVTLIIQADGNKPEIRISASGKDAGHVLTSLNRQVTSYLRNL